MIQHIPVDDKGKREYECQSCHGFEHSYGTRPPQGSVWYIERTLDDRAIELWFCSRRCLEDYLMDTIPMAVHDVADVTTRA